MSRNYKKIDWLLIVIPIISILILSLVFFIYPEPSKHLLQDIRHFLNTYLTPYYLGIGILFICSTLFLAFSKYGRLKLGNINDKPEYPTLKWGMMIFTSTMSADIIFYSLCEWMMYDQESFIKSKNNPLGWSLTYSLFHWGPIAWSFYLMLAVAFGYMLYVTKNKRQKFSEACRPLLGKHVDGWTGKIIDLIAIFALIAATATTFSMSMPLLATAVGTIFNIKNIKLLSIMLMVIVVMIYLTCAVIGMKAISKLSIVAFSILGLFLVYILIFSGDVKFILQSGGSAIKRLIINFIPMSISVNNSSFTQNWTIYYWAYWMVWCVATPFFIGSISKGRTIRSVIGGGYFWGLSGTFISFLILSNFGIKAQLSGLLNSTKLIASGSSYAEVIIKLIKTLPNYYLGLILLSLAMIGLYSTVFDSITTVVSKYSYKNLLPEENPSRLMRGFWAIVFIILPMALLFGNDSVYDIQSVAIIAAFPAGIVMIIIVASFYKEIVNRK